MILGHSSFPALCMCEGPLVEELDQLDEENE